MITAVLSILLFFIFTVLGLFHFYWLFGGAWGLDKVIPLRMGETTQIKIPRLATLVVAVILLFFGVIYLERASFISLPLPNILMLIACWFIPTIFLIRAIGDFRYLGLFKKIKDTAFAKADTTIFVPLCLFIAGVGAALQLL